MGLFPSKDRLLEPSSTTLSSEKGRTMLTYGIQFYVKGWINYVDNEGNRVEFVNYDSARKVALDLSSFNAFNTNSLAHWRVCSSEGNYFMP